MQKNGWQARKYSSPVILNHENKPYKNSHKIKQFSRFPETLTLKHKTKGAITLMPTSEGIIHGENGKAQKLLDDTASQTHTMTLEVLGQAPSIEKFMALMKHVFEVSDLIGKQFQKMFPIEKPLACKSGCSFCCSNITVMTKPAFAIYALYYSKIISDGLAYDHAAQQALTKHQDCCLLKEGACSIYPARPLVCRLFHSYDFNECLAHNFSRSGTSAEFGLIAVFNGLEKGLKELGLDCNDIAFNQAIGLLLSEEYIAEKWLAGEKVFAPCYIESRQ
ncbi:MAG: YkgJ family cysteine cluster protein [Rhodospirillales bacterium]|nr:YkgJ family cysteine cluster protein [Rhodospirillales bacterium]